MGGLLKYERRGITVERDLEATVTGERRGRNSREREKKRVHAE